MCVHFTKVIKMLCMLSYFAGRRASDAALVLPVSFSFLRWGPDSTTRDTSRGKRDLLEAKETYYPRHVEPLPLLCNPW
jgi:hypothetical protein